MISSLAEWVLIFITRIFSGMIIRSTEENYNIASKVYYANHTSHLDLLAILSSFPQKYRRRLYPVAALDYWGRGVIRRYIAEKVLHCILVDRRNPARIHRSISEIKNILERGESILIFPEGSRNKEGGVSDFQGGIYLIAELRPQTEFIPIRLVGLHKTLPKGEWLPAPNISRIYFGSPIKLQEKERRADFVNRCREELLALTGENDD